MKERLRTLLRKLLRPGAGAGHGKPPPSFIRVSYFAPRQVVLLTARHEGAENVWPIDWHVPLSIDPQLYGISLSKGGFGAGLIRDSRQFIVHFVPRSWEETIFFCGSTSGRDVDKFAEAGLVREEASTVDAPRLAQALGFLECQVEQVFDVGDHTFFVGRVTHAEDRSDAARLHHLDSSLSEIAGTFE